MATYIPRVLLCGDENDFRKTVGDKPVEIVGRINFAQAADATKTLLDDAEYFVFTDAVEFALYLKNFPTTGRVMSAESFAAKIHDGFFSYDALDDFYGLVRRKKISGHVLDFDCYLAKSDFRTASWGGGIKLIALLRTSRTRRFRFTKMFTRKLSARSTNAVTKSSTRYF